MMKRKQKTRAREDKVHKTRTENHERQPERKTKEAPCWAAALVAAAGCDLGSTFASTADTRNRKVTSRTVEIGPEITFMVPVRD